MKIEVHLARQHMRPFKPSYCGWLFDRGKSMNDRLRAAMTELPTLPSAAVDEHNLQGGRMLYTADQMRSYAAAAVAAAVPQWQPIETAPKDADVLLYVAATKEQFVAYWDDGWRFAPNAKLKTPTHWMPLPAAPEAPRC